METPTSRPTPGEFLDFRAYLRTMIAYLKEHQRGFSYRWFARRAGFSSPSFLKSVAEGKRNMSLASIAAFGRALGHNRREQEVFENLVLFGQAQTDAERNRYYERLRRSGAGGDRTVHMDTDQFDVYSHWYVIPIRELMLHSDFREDPEWIARKTRPPIRPADAQKALELLERVGLAARDENGVLKPVSVKLASGSGAAGPLAARNYHRSMLELASRTLDEVPVDQRNISSLTISLSRGRYEEICERIKQFRAELLDIVEDDRANGEDRKLVYLLGFQLFPLTGEEPE